MDIKLAKQNFKEKTYSDSFKEYLDKELFTIKVLSSIVKVYGYGDVIYKVGIDENGKMKAGEHLFIYAEKNDNIPCFSIDVTADSERAMVDDFVRGLQKEDYRHYNLITRYSDVLDVHFFRPVELI